MDNDKSIDGFRTQPTGATSTPPTTGHASSDATPSAGTSSQPSVTTAPQPEAPTGGGTPVSSDVKTDIEVLRHKNKSLKVWLVVLLVLLTAIVVGFGVYFVQTNKAQNDLDAAQAQNQQLQQQIDKQNATSANQQISSLESQVSDLTAQNETLTSQNQTLTQQVKTLNTYITDLTATANTLKTTCGSACSSITIPPAPASSTATE